MTTIHHQVGKKSNTKIFARILCEFEIPQMARMCVCVKLNTLEFKDYCNKVKVGIATSKIAYYETQPR